MGIIYLVDEDHNVLNSVVHRGLDTDELALTCPFGEGVAGRVALSRQPIAEDVCEDWEGLVGSDHDSKAVRVLGVPMIWHDELLGVLDLAADPDRRPFTQTDIRLARSVAYQAANALGIAKLIESERTQFKMAESLQEAALVISQYIDLDEILDRILEQVMDAFPCDASSILRIKGDRAQMIRSRGKDLIPFQKDGIRIEQDKYLRTMLDGDVVIESITKGRPSKLRRFIGEKTNSWIGAPIRYGHDILGFIILESSEPGIFNGGTSQLLVAFAAHAAAAMHKAELYHKLAEEHRRLRTLYSIEREVTVTLEPDLILSRLLEGVADAIDGVCAQTLLLNPDEDEQFTRGPYLYRQTGVKDLITHPQIIQLAEQVVENLSPVKGSFVYPQRSYEIIAFPVAAGRQILGVAIIWMENELESIDAWLEIFRTVGQQTGLALTNAEQHAQVQRRLTEMTILQRVVSAIASRLEVEAMLREVTEQLHIKLAFPAVQIYRRIGEELVLQQNSGPRPIVERMSIERGITGRVARTGRPAFVKDVRRDPDYVSGLVGTVAELAVPIKLGDEIIGVLNIETSDPSEIDESALELLMLLADQLSVALQNALLYEQVQESVLHLEDQIQLRTRELEQALDSAKSADRAKAEFVGDISHELRTPLTNIGLYLDLLEMGDPTRSVEYMATLRRETERLSSLIEQLLAISHLDTEQVKIHPKPSDVNSLVKVLMVDRARMIGAKGLDLKINSDEAIPNACIDPPYIIQALTNLLTNAMNYTPSGGKITITTSVEYWKAEPWVTISVRDSGPGISEIERKKIFSRFYRGLVGRASGIPGTGLGLSICKEIVERHGGRITISSDLGKGTTFIVWLPVAKEGEEDEMGQDLSKVGSTPSKALG
jgi:signal transduction histidine kinase